MNYVDVCIRGFSSLFMLFLISKIMGRKQAGQLNLFDYTIGITIGSLVAEVTLNRDVILWEGILTILLFGIVSILISILTVKSIRARRFFTGSPVLLVENGKILMKNLQKMKFDVNDLLQEARNNGYFDLSEVSYAIMEANGRISFLLKSKYNPVTPNDLKLKVPKKGLTSNLLIDGVIMEENLKEIGHDKKWLLKRLENEGYTYYQDLLLVLCDTQEKLTIYKKEEEQKKHSSLE